MVFDSVNGNTVKSKDGKPLRSAVTDKSQHLPFWNEAIKVFESMYFINKSNGKKSIPPCVKNWIQTLHAFKYLWNEKLKKISNFKFLIPRNINQDSIECLFGSIRNHGVRNINPTSYQFIASFKTLLINNFSSGKVSWEQL